MRIKRITSHVLRAPIGDRTFHSSQQAFPERTSYLVRVETADGVVGWGEGGQYGPAAPVAACVDHVLGPRLIGRDPCEPVRLWEDLYAYSRDFGQRGTYVEAISALDIACWDIAGQAAGLPVWKMLGGRFRDRVTAYATGLYYPEDFTDLPAQLRRLEGEAGGYADAGFAMVKGKVGLLSLEDDLARLRAVREVIGPGVGLAVDANHGYNAASASRFARMMEPLDVAWFEEPVVPEDLEGYRRVRATTTIPIAGGECAFTRWGFRDFIEGGCADIVQPDLAAAGGFSEFRNIMALATAHGLATVPHVWGSGVAVATALHALATVPPFPHTASPIPGLNAPVVEFDRTPNPLRDDLLDEPFVLEDGALRVPEGAGLGVRVREDVVARYAV